ncbi:YqgE/AlgH family protein [Parvularcula lutaonensis]|uniref:UPF0301 protein ACFONP_13710 n=1 Tax=Parvularcula lutaonensis TaxID=491923 RepID=A0ABV7MGT8_9PROT|nr:YqgE/AlgH family protein [Parvularcula lutaonensis]GGY54899.1 UPF0301 protein [Parvularcula lutaonensis]
MAHSTIPSIDLSKGFVGKLIVAMPHLADTPFEQAVCLICSHDDEHAFGVVVNKPMSGITVAEVVSQMDIDADESAERAPVFFGGPVDLQRGAVLHTLDFKQDETVVIGPNIGLTATKDALEAICTSDRAPEKWRLVMGHAGWDGGQLENEIKRNDWLSIDATEDRVFGGPADAWDEALKHLGISDPALFAGQDSPVIRPN